MKPTNFFWHRRDEDWITLYLWWLKLKPGSKDTPKARKLFGEMVERLKKLKGNESSD